LLLNEAMLRLPGAESTPSSKSDTEAFEAAVDLLLQRAALVTRLRHGRPPDPLAGLKVDEHDVASLLAELPGLQVGDDTKARELELALAKPIAAAREQLAKTLAGDGRLARVVQQAGLSELESEVLAVLVAVELDPRRQRLVGYLNDDVTQRRLNLWSLGELLGWSDDLVRAVAPTGGLRRAALLAPLGEGSWSATPIVVAPALLWWLGTGGFLDPELPAGVEVVAGPGTGTAALVVCASPDRTRRLQAVVRALCADAFIVSKAPTDSKAWDALVRQATMAGCGVILEVDDALSSETRDHVERAHHLAWGVTSALELPIASLFQEPFLEVEADHPHATANEWAATFPDEQLREQTGPTYRLTAQQLHEVARAVNAGRGDLASGVRRLAAGNIEASAARIRPTRTFEDIVLEGERLQQVREIALRHRQRDLVFDKWGFSPQPSTGVVALFAGASGTGKTLAAEIVAGDLGVDLYKVDLANLVSKYIGDTEKNLSRVFDAAEASRVVLFFDEADALLGKRSEVSDSHDRYANIEVAYLLQRLERYEGVAILATNLASNLDPAFLRRLHVVVEFPMPQAPERKRIWTNSFPERAPLSNDIDFDRLANEVEVTGGTIHNVANRAAFLAADAGSPITMELVLVALRRELEKIGRLAISSEWLRVFDKDAKR
jgi:ATP-dependent 26S proteasome regulatory subunit